MFCRVLDELLFDLSLWEEEGVLFSVGGKNFIWLGCDRLYGLLGVGLFIISCENKIVYILI